MCTILTMPNPRAVSRFARRLAAILPLIAPIAFAAPPTADPVDDELSLVAPLGPVDATPATGVLTEDALVAEVLASNPSIEQMTAAWSAAQARIRQARALDDPMVVANVAPQSFQSNDVGYRIEASQKFYAPGKRRLRERASTFEASAAEQDIEETRQKLAEQTSLAFYDYFLVLRTLDINAEAREVVQRLKTNAESRFAAGQVLQQDVLQADVELGRLEEQRLSLTRQQAIQQARINTLLNRELTTVLPAVPLELPTPSPPEDSVALTDEALTNRPELRELLRQIEAERAKWALACKEYYPDFEVIGAYDSFWRAPDGDLRAMVGIRMNAPIRRGRRNAAVSEAQSRVAERILAHRAFSNEVRFEVSEAHERVRASDAIVRLYGERLLHAAEQSLTEAQSGYITNRTDFLTLVTAQRNLIDLRLRYFEAVAAAYKDRASLRRAVGTPVVN